MAMMQRWVEEIEQGNVSDPNDRTVSLSLSEEEKADLRRAFSGRSGGDSD